MEMKKMQKAALHCISASVLSVTPASLLITLVHGKTVTLDNILAIKLELNQVLSALLML